MGQLQLHHLRKLLSKEELEEFCSESCDSSDKPAPCKSDCLRLCPSYSCLVTYDHERKSHKFLIITLTVLAVTFVALLCYILYFKYYLARRASRRRAQLEAEVFRDNFVDQDHHRPEVDHHVWYINTVGLQPGIISSIAVCQYKRGDGLVEGTECSVCLNEFEEDETLRLLPKCNHAFHLPCIDTWLRSHTNCPMCRAPILKNNATGDSSSSEPRTDNSSTSSDTQVDAAEGDSETDRELEEGVLERRAVTEFGSELPLERGRIKRSESSDEIQAIRRSVSLDSVTASKLSKCLANFFNIPEETQENSDTQMETEKDSRSETASKRVTRNGSLPRFIGSSSIVRSLQIGPVSFKRSSSYSGKFLLSRRS